MTSSDLVMTELTRAVRKKSIESLSFDLDVHLIKAEIILDDVTLYPVERLTFWRAGRLFEPRLRSLDAIHVTTALGLRPIEAFVSYDKRQLEAARRAGLPTVSPGMKF
jgi:predicted nucleic acid-binding protein